MMLGLACAVTSAFLNATRLELAWLWKPPVFALTIASALTRLVILVPVMLLIGQAWPADPLITIAGFAGGAISGFAFAINSHAARVTGSFLGTLANPVKVILVIALWPLILPFTPMSEGDADFSVTALGPGLAALAISTAAALWMLRHRLSRQAILLALPPALMWSVTDILGAWVARWHGDPFAIVLPVNIAGMVGMIMVCLIWRSLTRTPGHDPHPLAGLNPWHAVVMGLAFAGVGIVNFLALALLPHPAIFSLIVIADGLLLYILSRALGRPAEQRPLLALMFAATAIITIATTLL